MTTVVPHPLQRLKRRADFVRASRGRRAHATAFTVQVAPQPQPGQHEDPAPCDPRIGFTITKKVGNAVVRNRIRRRLREAVRLSEALPVEPGHDYVIVARREALALPFETLVHELEGAVRRGGARRPPRHRRDSPVAD